jgi:predicted kinase
MSKLIITRGLPGSGKTTYAKRWVSEDSLHRSRLNRDDFREMLHGGAHGYDRPLEQAVTFAHQGAVRTLLMSGRDVICDDMNLQNRQVKEWMKLAKEAGADFEVVDLTNVLLDECIQRDMERGSRGGRLVGAEYIEKKYEQFLKGRKYPLPLPELSAGQYVEPYVARPDAPKAILVDIDGTLALMNGRRPYDWDRVSEDAVNWPIRHLVDWITYGFGSARKRVLNVIFMSGRDESCRAETLRWLETEAKLLLDAASFDTEDQMDWGFELYMRPEGDMRPDHVVKLELFDEHIRNQYDVQLVLDDRDQVVDMWRRLGLTCLQVADGAF